MYFGTSIGEGLVKNSKAVGLKAVPVTTFTPLTNTSAVEPFHLMAILEVSVKVEYNKVDTPAMYLNTKSLEPTPPLNANEFKLPAIVSANAKPRLEASLVNARLFLKSTNQVPPLAVISPLVKMLPRLIMSAFLVTDAELVGM
jgi:hypothetical protein